MRTRCAGILLHPTSLPGRHGIGDLGQGVDQFIDWLVAARQTLWQVLPLGPTGYGDSPYQPFSAFAGNPLLIDLTALGEAGLLTEDELASRDPFDAHAVDYGKVIGSKTELLRLAWSRARDDAALAHQIDAFAETSAHWLPDYGLFMACKIDQGWRSWTDWPREIALREPDALHTWGTRLADEIGFQRFAQYLFSQQWGRVHKLANDAGIRIVGDLPIFVGHDSADVWARQELFTLDENGQPTVVAGVPPDYFSATGQLWGNPHYRWRKMRDNGYAWWLARLHRVLEQVDVIRLDHFRGFSGYWEVPADEETAINGRWVKGPGRPFFDAVAAEFGGLPLIAEDLGVITEDVAALRTDLGLPGMRVLQFAFDSDAASGDMPHNFEPDTIVYTGTHDNDTTRGWYADGSSKSHHKARLYVGGTGADIHWDMINLAMRSVADRAVVPLQDVLGLGTEARMNLPGRPHGNWCWRCTANQLSPRLADALAQITSVTGRWIDPDASPVGDDEVEALVYGEPTE